MAVGMHLVVTMNTLCPICGVEHTIVCMGTSDNAIGRCVNTDKHVRFVLQEYVLEIVD